MPDQNCSQNTDLIFPTPSGKPLGKMSSNFCSVNPEKSILLFAVKLLLDVGPDFCWLWAVGCAVVVLSGWVDAPREKSSIVFRINEEESWLETAKFILFEPFELREVRAIVPDVAILAEKN